LSLIRSLADLPEPDVLVVPGGFGTRALMHDAPFLDWIRHVHDHSTWTTSVCTGSLVLAAAGLLDGREATTHWLQTELLKPYGALPVSQRVVRSGKIVTAAGVSSGIDMALMLAAEIAGDRWAQGIQLGIGVRPAATVRGRFARTPPRPRSSSWSARDPTSSRSRASDLPRPPKDVAYATSRFSDATISACTSAACSCTSSES